MLQEAAFSAAVSDAVRDEAALRAALAECDIAPMLMVLTQLSGDLTILDEVAPHIQGAWSFMEAVPEDLKQTVRDRLVAVLKDYAATGRKPPKDLPEETLQRMMSAGVGATVPEDYIPLLVEETDLTGNDSRAEHWHRRPDEETLAKYKVAIIGAGFSGLCMAIRLQQLGIPFTIYEKNPDVGGTWLENRYPGCAVDTPNHFYSYSFFPNSNWTRHFSRRDELLAYIRSAVEHFGLRPHIRFNAEITRAAFDPARAVMGADVRERGDGGGESRRQCCRPAQPAIRAGNQRGRPVPRADVPHGSVGCFGRPEGQARGAHRHGRLGDADGAVDRAGGGAAADLPAHAALGRQ